jgi:hypothetical protein
MPHFKIRCAQRHIVQGEFILERREIGIAFHFSKNHSEIQIRAARQELRIRSARRRSRRAPACGCAFSNARTSRGKLRTSHTSRSVSRSSPSWYGRPIRGVQLPTNAGANIGAFASFRGARVSTIFVRLGRGRPKLSKRPPPHQDKMPRRQFFEPLEVLRKMPGNLVLAPDHRFSDMAAMAFIPLTAIGALIAGCGS